jgi:ribose transport system permease protein
LLTLDVGIGLPETGDGWEFKAIAGCAVGGVSLAGGKGSPLGVFIGVSLVFIAETAIIFLGLPTTMRVAVQGMLMAGAVLFDLYKQRRKVPA